jgi:tetratricopeptide (TPR) repeat protein
VLEAEANSLINLGIDYTHSGKTDETTSVFDEVRDIFKRDAWFRWRYNIRLEAATTEHWLRLGDLSKAGEFAQRLLDTASRYEVHKYIAVAHKLIAQISIADGDPAGGESELMAALEELRQHPVPVVAWKTYAQLGRLKSSLGDFSAARDSFARAAEIVNACAANINDAALREIFLNSDAVREVVAGASKSATVDE